MGTERFEPFTEQDAKQTIHGRIEQIVARQPDRIAIKTKTECFTYEEMDRRANAIAIAITERFGANIEPVCLVFRPGADSVISLLGVMKSRKIAVCLNPGMPVGSILNRIQTRLIITDSESISENAIPGSGSTEIWEAKRIKMTAFNDKLRNFGVEVISQNDPAYVVFTFGSTNKDRPKAVLHTHKGDVLLSRHLGKMFDITSDDVFANLRFNTGGLHDIFCCLQNGAQLAAKSIRTAEDLRGLAEWINEEKVTYLKTVASMYGMAVNTSTKFPYVRVVDIGGEMINLADVKDFRLHFSDFCVFAARYACTETNVVSYRVIKKKENINDEIKKITWQVGREAFPVGWAVPDNKILIVEKERNPVRPGEVGEIAVQGPGLAVKYLDEDEPTVQKFATLHGQKTFFTGDWGIVWPENGCLYHLGRGKPVAEITPKAYLT
jgi:acyl-CoA synthetase (AMP-forming)/AMP-acid ligase II